MLLQRPFADPMTTSSSRTACGPWWPGFKSWRRRRKRLESWSAWRSPGVSPEQGVEDVGRIVLHKQCHRSPKFWMVYTVYSNHVWWFGGMFTIALLISLFLKNLQVSGSMLLWEWMVWTGKFHSERRGKVWNHGVSWELGVARFRTSLRLMSTTVVHTDDLPTWEISLGSN